MSDHKRLTGEGTHWSNGYWHTPDGVEALYVPYDEAEALLKERDERIVQLESIVKAARILDGLSIIIDDDFDTVEDFISARTGLQKALEQYDAQQAPEKAQEMSICDACGQPVTYSEKWYQVVGQKVVSGHKEHLEQKYGVPDAL